MPLMTSPIDGSPMTEVERYGVKLDICPTSGGIWVDRGELEKIIMGVREEALMDGGGCCSVLTISSVSESSRCF